MRGPASAGPFSFAPPSVPWLRQGHRPGECAAATVGVWRNLRRVNRLMHGRSPGRLAVMIGLDLLSVRRMPESLLPQATTMPTLRAMAREPRNPNGGEGAGTAVITKTRPVTKKPPLYRVLLLNDD